MKSPWLPNRIKLHGHEWLWRSCDQLNHEKYNQRIRASAHWPFMYSWYWDAVCSKWGAYVLADYEEVFPVYQKWKWGVVPMLVTPYCVKWIEGKSSIAEYVATRFMGFKNLAFPFELTGAKPTRAQILSKNSEWTASGDLKRNIKKAEQQGYEFEASGTWQNFTHLMKSFHPYPWNFDDECAMHRLYEKSSKLGVGFLSEVKLGNELVASYFYILQNSQLLFIQNVSDSQHRAGSPMALLIHSILESFSIKNDSLDIHFMGSANEGVAEYNKKFGAVDFEYYRLKNY